MNTRRSRRRFNEKASWSCTRRRSPRSRAWSRRCRSVSSRAASYSLCLVRPAKPTAAALSPPLLSRAARAGAEIFRTQAPRGRGGGRARPAPRVRGDPGRKLTGRLKLRAETARA